MHASPLLVCTELATLHLPAPGDRVSAHCVHACACRWPAGEEDLLQKKPPVIAALDPGRANKFFASVRSTHPGDLRDRDIAPSWRDKRTGVLAHFIQAALFSRH